jgi:hypothetical protein
MAVAAERNNLDLHIRPDNVWCFPSTAVVNETTHHARGRHCCIVRHEMIYGLPPYISTYIGQLWTVTLKRMFLYLIGPIIMHACAIYQGRIVHIPAAAGLECWSAECDDRLFLPT